MRKKAVTTDCIACELMKINDRSQMVCHWGKQEKILEAQKGKKPLTCKLKR